MWPPARPTRSGTWCRSRTWSCSPAPPSGGCRPSIPTRSRPARSASSRRAMLAPATCSRSSSTTRWSMKLHAAGTCGRWLTVGRPTALSPATCPCAPRTCSTPSTSPTWPIRRRRIRLCGRFAATAYSWASPTFPSSRSARGTGTSPTVASSLLPSSQRGARMCSMQSSGARRMGLRCATWSGCSHGSSPASRTPSSWMPVCLIAARRRRQSAASITWKEKQFPFWPTAPCIRSGLSHPAPSRWIRLRVLFTWACPMFPTSKPCRRRSPRMADTGRASRRT